MPPSDPRQLSVTDVDALLQQLMAPDNTLRNGAEQYYQHVQQHAPEVLCPLLLRVIGSGTTPAVKGLAAVLLRRVFFSLGDDIVARLGGGVASPAAGAAPVSNALQGLKGDVLALLGTIPEKSVRNKVCDVVGMLADRLLPHGQWPELFPFMFGAVNSADANAVEASLRIFYCLPHYVAEAMEQHLPRMAELFGSCLVRPEPAIQLAAFQAVGALLEHVERPSQRQCFQPLLQPMLQALAATLSVAPPRTDAALAMLFVFVEVAQEHAQFFRPALGPLVDAMLQLSHAEQVDENVRQMGLEVLLAVAEGAPGMVKKLSGGGDGGGGAGKDYFVQRVAPLCFGLMQQHVEEDAEWESARGDDGTDSEGFLFEAGRDALDRLVAALGARKALQFVFQLVGTAAGAKDDWRGRHTAMVALQQVAEYTPSNPRQLRELLQLVLPFMQDAHPRVRNAATRALGQMCADHGPKLQSTQHQEVVPALVRSMQMATEPCLRVQATAVLAMTNFLELCDDRVLEPYTQTLLQALFELMRDRPHASPVQAAAVTAVAVVAETVGSSFAQYYDTFIPILKHVLATVTTEAADADEDDAAAVAVLRGKVLECIAIVGAAVGRDKFRADALALMQMLASSVAATGQSLIEKPLSDPQQSYMLQCWARIAETLGAEFMPYLQTVMPPLIAAAGVEAEKEITLTPDQFEALQGADSDSETETVQAEDGKALQIRTSLLEEKAQACRMLTSMVRSLKEGVTPFVEQVYSVMAPLCTGSVHADIRQAALVCLPELLAALSRHHHLQASRQPTAEAQARAHTEGRAVVRHLLGLVVSTQAEALQEEQDMDALQVAVRALGQSVELAAARPDMHECAAHGGEAGQPGHNAADGAGEAAVLTVEELQQLSERLVIVIQESFQRRMVRAAEKQAAEDEYDEEDEANDAAANDEEVQLLYAVAEAIGVLIKTHQGRFMPVFNTLIAPQIETWGAEQRLATDRTLAVFIVDDFFEHACGVAVESGHFARYMPLLLNCCGAPPGPPIEPALAQGAVYGIGMAARAPTAAFAPFCSKVLEVLLALCERPDALSDENGAVSDNAASALGLVMDVQRETPELSAEGVLHGLFPRWLARLPLRHDRQESLVVLRRLTDLLARNDAALLGAGGANVPRIVAIFADAHAHQLFDEALRPVAGQLLAQMQSQIPEQLRSAVIAGLSAEQQQCVAQLVAAASSQLPTPPA